MSPARPRTIYALLGKPVAENSTEEMIEAAFSAASVDTEYLSLTVEPEALDGGRVPLSPTVGTASQRGDVVEEVRFVRDEMANMAWGVERVVENGVGDPWPAHERALEAAEHARNDTHFPPANRPL